jgi:hypothetical protein
MRPPIIIDNHGDMLFFDTIQQAEKYLEPIDVRNQEYAVYDSAGMKLRQVIKLPEPFNSFRQLLFPVEQVELIVTTENCASELKDKLAMYIERLQQMRQTRCSRGLSERFEKAMDALESLKHPS